MNKINPLISLKNVGLRFKTNSFFFHKATFTDVLADIDIEIFQGEVVGIIGKNGAGKTSLLQLMSGIVSPTSGTIETNASNVTLLSLRSGFMNNLNGHDNSILIGMLYGYSFKSMKTKIHQILDYSELGDSFFSPVGKYSAGMKVRLGFAISSIIQPQVLLIDETLSVGDERFRKKSTRMIQDKTQASQSVVIVSHSLSQIKKLCTRVLWIDFGRIRMMGDPQEIVTSYQIDN